MELSLRFFISLSKPGERRHEDAARPFTMKDDVGIMFGRILDR